MMEVGINSPEGEIMSDRGIGRGFNKLVGHVRDLSKSKEKDTPPSTPRASEKKDRSNVKFNLSPSHRETHAPLTPRSVAKGKPDANASMSSSAPPKRSPPPTPDQFEESITARPQNDDDWLKEVLANLDPEEDSQSDDANSSGKSGEKDNQVLEATTATTTPRPIWGPPPVRATIVEQPPIEHVRHDPLPTIGTRQQTPLPSSTTTTTTQRTSDQLADPRASVRLPDVPVVPFEEETIDRPSVKPDELSKEDLDKILHFDESSFPPEKPQTPIPPEKPARLQRPKIPSLNLGAKTDTAEKPGTKTKVDMFPEFKQARPDKDGARTPRTSRMGHRRTGSNQPGNEPAKGTTKIITRRRIVTDLPATAAKGTPEVGTLTPRTKPLPELPSPRSEAKTPRKPLPQPSSYRASLEKKSQGSEKPSEGNAARPDVNVDALTPASPRDRDDQSIPKAKGPDQGREKPDDRT
jgi:hypothetical protein